MYVSEMHHKFVYIPIKYPRPEDISELLLAVGTVLYIPYIQHVSLSLSVLTVEYLPTYLPTRLCAFSFPFHFHISKARHCTAPVPWNSTTEALKGAT